MNRRIHLLAGCVALAFAAVVPAAHAATPTVVTYEGVSASGTYDYEAEYYDSSVAPENCRDADGYHHEEGANFKLRSGDSGGILTNRTGALILPLRGGYDGVYRKLDCNGNPISSCERHHSYARRAMVTLQFIKKGRGARVLGTLSSAPPETECPLPGVNGFFIGRDRVSGRQLRSKRPFTVNLSRGQTITEDIGTQVLNVGSSEVNLEVKVRRG